MAAFTLEDFPISTYDKVRYGDTDRQGHVNNSVFNSFLETGRVELLYNNLNPLHLEGSTFVIASLQINFLKEIHWPGKVEIGTGVTRIGNSSFTLFQMLFQHGKCVADATTVIVQVDGETGKGAPLSDETRAAFEKLLLKE
ncbi:MAG: acyl-CoA thioesterase [Saprospiraceae bacterium]|nr:acyl-CoA thioesterase [Saprospiraceae bacterium]